ncbi:MAG: hypothetical protein JWP38_1094 [Herbaspirillum sp.]|nr:hypothetical protein [Herbaspirillum sp.]
MNLVLNYCARRLRPLRQSFCFLLCLSACLSASGHAPALPPDAGNALNTQASVTFYAEDSTVLRRGLSNVVTVRMLPVPALTFSQSEMGTAQADRSFAIPVALINSGNTAVGYTLDVQSDLEKAPTLVLDVNRDGARNADDLEIDPHIARHIAYAKYDAFLLVGAVPADAVEGTVYRIVIAAKVPGADGPIAQTHIYLQVRAAPQMRVMLNATPQQQQDGADTMRVTATLVNSGKQNLQMGQPVVIDGLSEKVTLLRYRIPEGMRYLDADLTQEGDGSSAQLLFSKRAASEFNYLSDSRPEEVAEIALALKTSLLPRQRHGLTFTLKREIHAQAGPQPRIESHAEAYDGGMTPALSNLLIFDPATQDSPDIEPRIFQRDAEAINPSTWLEIKVSNIGAAATQGTLVMHGVVPAVLHNSDIDAAGWHCITWRSGAGSSFRCTNPSSLSAGSHLPPVSIQIPNNVPGSGADGCGPDKKIVVSVSVPNELQSLTANNRAQAPLICKGGAVIRGRAWINAANDGIYTPGEEVLPGWRAQLMRAGKVIKEAITDSQGQYRIAGITPNVGYSLRFLSPEGRIEAPPLNSRDSSGALAIDAERDFVNGALVYREALWAREYPDQDMSFIPTGVIFNAQTVEPVANAKITLSGPKNFSPRIHLVGAPDNATFVSDAKGHYNFFLTPSAPPGIYRMKVEARGFDLPQDDDVLTLNETSPSQDSDDVRQAYKVFETPGIPSFSGNGAAPSPSTPEPEKRRLLTSAAPRRLRALSEAHPLRHNG